MKELHRICRHAGTILVGQLAVIAFGVADTLIVGRYSDAALAALSVGSALYISVFVGLMGIVQALLPVWAELLGAGSHARLGQSLRQSLYLCALVSVAGMSALLLPGPLLRWAEVPGAMQAEVTQYLTVLAYAFVPALLFRLYTAFNQSLGKPVVVTWLQIGALALKIPLSIWLVGGGGGVEPMGAVGCAWATLAVNYALLTMALAMLRSQAMYRPFAIWQPMEPPDWHQLGRFLQLGLPAGLAYGVEVTSFTLMALFIARLGTVATASHQIAASVAAVLYMVPLSLAVATSTRVSFWLGAGDTKRAGSMVFVGLKLAGVTALSLAVVILLASRLLAGSYSANPEIVATAAALLRWVAVYHVADSVQAICAFLLRCYRITLVPLALYGVLLWGLGLYGGYRIAYVGIGNLTPSNSAASFWLASTVAIALVAACLLVLIVWAVRRSQRSAHKTVHAA